MKLSGVLTWLLLIAIFISGPAAGFDIDRLELRHLGKEAEFVFIGTVEAIDYRFPAQQGGACKHPGRNQGGSVFRAGTAGEASACPRLE